MSGIFAEDAERRKMMKMMENGENVERPLVKIDGEQSELHIGNGLSSAF